MVHILQKVPVQVKGKKGPYQSTRVKRMDQDIDEKRSRAQLVYLKTFLDYFQPMY